MIYNLPLNSTVYLARHHNYLCWCFNNLQVLQALPVFLSICCADGTSSETERALWKYGCSSKVRVCGDAANCHAVLISSWYDFAWHTWIWLHLVFLLQHIILQSVSFYSIWILWTKPSQIWTVFKLLWIFAVLQDFTWASACIRSSSWLKMNCALIAFGW